MLQCIYIIMKGRKENYDYFAEILIYDRLHNKCVGTTSSRRLTRTEHIFV